MAKKKNKKAQQQQFLSPQNFLRQRARSLAIGECYFTPAIEETGEGIAIVSRKHTGGRVSYAVYLVDIWCVGVKDTYYRLRCEESDFEAFVEHMGPQVEPMSYEEVHNWIYGAVAFADEAGIPPHKDFALTKYMLEEDTDDIPLIDHEFGKEGKYFLVAKNGLEASRYLPYLKKNIGEGNFDFLIESGSYDGYEDYDYDYSDEDDEEGQDGGEDVDE